MASEPLLSVSRVYCEDKTSFSYAHYFSFHHFTLPCIPLKQNSVTQISVQVNYCFNYEGILSLCLYVCVSECMCS